MKFIEEGFILCKTYSSMDEYIYTFSPCEMQNYGYVTVCPHNIEIEIPDDFNPIPGQVANLQAKALQLKAEFAKNMMEIEDSISKLTCIEMSPT